MANQQIANCIYCKVFACPVAKCCSLYCRELSNDSKTVVSYKKGQLILKENTEAFGIHIIYDGKVIISSTRSGGRRQIIRLAKEGDILEYIQEGDKLYYPFSGEACTTCLVCFLPKEILSEILSHDTLFAQHLEKRYSKKIIEVEKRLTNALIMDSRAKVSDALLIIANAFDGRVPLLRKEIGEMIGISAAQVSREIKKLANERILELSKSHNELVIKDLERLKDIVRSYDASSD